MTRTARQSDATVVAGRGRSAGMRANAPNAVNRWEIRRQRDTDRDWSLCDLRASVWDHKKTHKAAENTEALFFLCDLRASVGS